MPHQGTLLLSLEINYLNNIKNLYIENVTSIYSISFYYSKCTSRDPRKSCSHHLSWEAYLKKESDNTDEKERGKDN